MNTQQPITETVEQVFIARQTLRGLQQTSSKRPVLIGDLVHYLHGSKAINGDALKQEINKSLTLRRQLNELVKQIRVANVPMQAQAASNEPLSERETRAFSLKIKKSRAHNEQLYLLLTVQPEAKLSEGHRPTLIVNNQTTIERLCFPALKDQQAQLMLVEGDDGLMLIRDPNSELSLI